MLMLKSRGKDSKKNGLRACLYFNDLPINAQGKLKCLLIIYQTVSYLHSWYRFSIAVKDSHEYGSYHSSTDTELCML